MSPYALAILPAGGVALHEGCTGVQELALMQSLIGKSKQIDG